jgi:hypothetical protein
MSRKMGEPRSGGTVELQLDEVPQVSRLGNLCPDDETPLPELRSEDLLLAEVALAERN